MKRTKTFLTNACALVGMCLLIFAVQASAATLTVNTTSDSGLGSLRQALIDATANAEANNIVFAIPIFDPNYDVLTDRFTITLVSALPDIPLAAMNITNSMSQGVTIMGDNSFRIFTLVNSAVVVMTNVTISNGGGQGIVNNGYGGAIYMGNSGTLTLNDCTVANNTATLYGGGVFMAPSATLHVNRSSFTGNASVEWGGALFVDSSGTINLNTSTLSGNSAGAGEGGAIVNWGTVNAVNNTFSGNSVLDGAGGAVSNYGTMTFTNNTIVQNQASFVGGIVNWETATINNNIIALNVGTSSVPDLFGTFAGTYNLVGDIDSAGGLTPTTNIWGNAATPLDPMIGPLQNNGGPTFTRALLIGSPAQDKGNSPGVITDQRGYGRPHDNASISNTGDGSDIGAFEMLAPTSASVSIGGQVLTSAGKDGRAISGVTIYLTDQDGVVRTARTNPMGFYSIPDVPAGGTYVGSARHKLYRFETRMVNLTDEIANMNWTPLN